jgi:hypothetical protein
LAAFDITLAPTKRFGAFVMPVDEGFNGIDLIPFFEPIGIWKTEFYTTAS